MKIIVLQDFLRSGGTERHAVLLAREFAELGHDARLVTFRPGGQLAPTAPKSWQALQPFDTRLDWFAPRLTSQVLGGDPDIVLCMGKTTNCFAGYLQRRADRRGRPTAVVATLRAGGELPEFYYASVRAASHLVTNSREAAALLVKNHGLDRQAVSVIYNSLVVPEGSGERNPALRAEMGAGAGTTVLLSVGMFRPEKNQKDLIEIVSGLPKAWDWQLWLAGEGPERAACEQLAAAKGLKSRVRFLGYQSDPAPLYRAADIAVHASKEEALSNFLIEAQAHGLPAVAMEALGIRECFVEGETGWMLAQGDFAGFLTALALLAADSPAQRAERAGQARAFARSSFDPARQVAAYISLFELLNRKRRANSSG